MFTVSMLLINPFFSVVLSALFYSLKQSNPNNFTYLQVACYTRITGFQSSMITIPCFLIFILTFLYVKNKNLDKIKRERMEKISQYIKPVDGTRPGSNARLLHFHAGRGMFLHIIVDIFSRNCQPFNANYEILALEYFNSKYFPESEYWLKQNAKLMGLHQIVTPISCDFKKFPIPSNSIDVVLHGFDNGGSRLIFMNIEEDFKSIYRMLKPGGFSIYFGVFSDKYRQSCTDAGFVDIQEVGTYKFFFFSLTVVVFKKPVDLSSMEESVEIIDIDKLRLATIPNSDNRQSTLKDAAKLSYFFPPGYAYRCIDACCVLYWTFFILYIVFVIGTFKPLSVPVNVPYNYYVSSQMISNISGIPYFFIFLYPLLLGKSSILIFMNNLM